MSLSEFSTIAGIVSSFAVAVSLVYLGLQTHQNAKHTRALIQQGRLGAIRELALSCTEHDFASAILHSLTGQATPDEVRQFQFRNYCGASLYGWQDTFHQYEMGLLDRDIYMQMRSAVARAMSTPPFRAEWETLFRVPGTKFAAFVDEIIATLPAAPSQEVRA
jgi:hypothetical protein